MQLDETGEALGELPMFDQIFKNSLRLITNVDLKIMFENNVCCSCHDGRNNNYNQTKAKRSLKNSIVKGIEEKFELSFDENNHCAIHPHQSPFTQPNTFCIYKLKERNLPPPSPLPLSNLILSCFFGALGGCLILIFFIGVIIKVAKKFKHKDNQVKSKKIKENEKHKNKTDKRKEVRESIEQNARNSQIIRKTKTNTVTPLTF